MLRCRIVISHALPCAPLSSPIADRGVGHMGPIQGHRGKLLLLLPLLVRVIRAGGVWLVLVLVVGRVVGQPVERAHRSGARVL
jgi:hypothetical protein